MFKSVFAKYVTAFAVIILISFLMVALIVASMVTDYASDDKKESIDRFAKMAQSIVERDYEKDDGSYMFDDYVQRNREHFKGLLDAVTQSDQSLTLFLTDEDGKLLCTLDPKYISAGDFYADGFATVYCATDASYYILNRKGELSEKGFVSISPYYPFYSPTP